MMITINTPQSSQPIGQPGLYKESLKSPYLRQFATSNSVVSDDVTDCSSVNQRQYLQASGSQDQRYLARVHGSTQ
jgi:hypothetical protein